MKNPNLFRRFVLCLLALLPASSPLLAQNGLPAFTSTPGPGGSQIYTLSIETLLTLSALTFIPALLLMMTSFTRIIIVLSILRHALGTQTSPPNQVFVGLALFLTFFIMSPVLEKAYTEAYRPFSENRINVFQAAERGAEPFRAFMLKQTRETDIGLFLKISNVPHVEKPGDVPLRVLIPAFVTSELKTAFQIGFVIFIPFLIIDMAVASVLMSMGMMMMSPIMIALPFKLMLFVLVDGWHLFLGSLVSSFSV